MKKIETFKTIEEALVTLDNGGWFFNLFTKAEDDVISKSELGKAAGEFFTRKQSILYLDLLLSGLDLKEKDVVLSRLDETMATAWEKYQPEKIKDLADLSPPEPESGVRLSGTPRLIGSHQHFGGHTMVPMMVGKVTIVMPVKMEGLYDVYELDAHTPPFFIVHSKNKTKLPEKQIRMTGRLKELINAKGETEPDKRYVEIAYFTDEM